MRFAFLGLFVIAAIGTAESSPGQSTTPSLAASPAGTPVIGGTAVPLGKWRDTAALLYPPATGGDSVECTGVLIAPTVVLTARHCIFDDELNEATPPSRVWIGTNSLSQPGRGEDLQVKAAKYHPGAYDLGLVILDRPSTIPPRLLATGWVRSDIVDGARVVFAGYGAIDREANENVNELQEGASTVTDAGCTRSVGCEPGARPDGEIGAGGMGIDTCPGDSGGPLYLLTSYGDFLAGITSRSYDNSKFACSEGGIYTRSDKAELVAWIEQQGNVLLPDGRGPKAEPMVVAAGDTETVTLDPNDPRTGATHRWELIGAPQHGTATIDAQGVLTYTAANGEGGTDVVRVRAIDLAASDRSARGQVDIEIVDGGGCCDAGGSATGIWPSLVVLGAILVRRRRTLRI